MMKLKRKPLKRMLGLFVLMLVASTASFGIKAAETGDCQGVALAERCAPAITPSSYGPWTGQSPRYGIRIVVTSGIPLDLDVMDTLVEAVVLGAGVSPAPAGTVEIGIIPHPQLQGIATALGIPEEVLSIRQGPNILLSEHLLDSGRALTAVLADHLLQAFQDQGTPVQEIRFGR